MAMEVPCSTLFEQLLHRVAAEHKREVAALRAEITRLQNERASPRMSSGNFDLEDDAQEDIRPLPIPKEDLISAAEYNYNPTMNEDYSHSTTATADQPDEEALAAAFAIATDISTDKELMQSVDVLPNGRAGEKRANGNGKSYHMEGSTEVLSLWDHIMKFVRHEVYLSELPAVHPKWNVEDTALNLKNLIGGANNSQTDKGANQAGPHAARHETAELGVVATELSQARFYPSLCQDVIHYATFVAKRSAPTIPMSPSSKLRVLWDCMGVVLLLHDLIMTPMAAFSGHGLIAQMPEPYTNDVTERLDIISAVFWTTDVVMSFITAFHSNAGIMETRMRTIAMHYIKGWFAVDVTIVGVDLILIILGNGSQGGLRVAKTGSRILRFTRLLRFAKMSKQVSELMARINSEYLLQVIGLLRLLLVIIVFNHYIACGWYGLTVLIDPYDEASVNDDVWGTHDTWVKHNLIERNKTSLAYSYFSSLHWSLTQFTPASMEIFPRNEYERMFNVVIIMLAFVFFSSFVSSITNAMTHIRNINAQAVARDTMLRRYFSENNISHGLAARVWHFVRQKRVAAGKKLKTDEVPILQQLPVRIRDELRCEVFGPLLKTHPMLGHYISICPPAAMRKICKKAISELSLGSGKELKFDDEVKKMIFVVSGTLEFHMYDLVEDDEGLVLEAGDWCCEAALWADTVPLDGHFIAAPGGSDLVFLDAETFRSIAVENFDTVDVLVKYSSLFIDRFREAMQDPTTVRENLLFNRHDIIKEMMLEVTVAPDRRRSLLAQRLSLVHQDHTTKSVASAPPRKSDSL